MEWKEYFNKHASRKPRELLVKAVPFCKNKEKALDLGAGTLIESNFLVENGFKKVLAIDNSPLAQEIAAKCKKDNIEFIQTSFQDYKFPKGEFDLVNAQFSLPFYGKENFKSFIENIKFSLKPHGIFVGQFFGTKDEWNDGIQHLAFQTKEEVIDLLSGGEVIELTEIEKEDGTASGKMKHWHIFNFIYRKN